MADRYRQDNTHVIFVAILACLAIAGWFTRSHWQASKTLPGEGRPDEVFAAVYTKYGIPALSRATASSLDVQPHLVALSKEPCNKHAIFQLSVNLEQKIGFRSTAALLQGYAQACPESSGEQYLAAELLYAAGDFKASIELASQVLALQPDASNVLYLRARALQSERRFEEALQDYATAIRLLPDGKDIFVEVFMRMSQSYEVLNRYCEAITPILLYIAYEAETRSTPQLENKIARLSQRGNCSSSAKGQARIPRQTKGVATLTAEINGVKGAACRRYRRKLCDLIQDVCSQSASDAAAHGLRGVGDGKRDRRSVARNRENSSSEHNFSGNRACRHHREGPWSRRRRFARYVVFITI